jgi:hypothetical protein
VARRLHTAAAQDALLAVAVADARVRRLRAELALARSERDDAVLAAADVGVAQVQVAEWLGLGRPGVSAMLRRLRAKRRRVETRHLT